VKLIPCDDVADRGLDPLLVRSLFGFFLVIHCVGTCGVVIESKDHVNVVNELDDVTCQSVRYS
jgi:hypothetical protein